MTTTVAEPGRPRRKMQLHDGRDEMNLVEFPFATLSERSGDTKVLEFQTDGYDRVVGKVGVQSVKLVSRSLRFACI